MFLGITQSRDRESVATYQQEGNVVSSSNEAVRYLDSELLIILKTENSSGRSQFRGANESVERQIEIKTISEGTIDANPERHVINYIVANLEDFWKLLGNGEPKLEAIAIHDVGSTHVSALMPLSNTDNQVNAKSRRTKMRLSEFLRRYNPGDTIVRLRIPEIVQVVEKVQVGRAGLPAELKREMRWGQLQELNDLLLDVRILCYVVATPIMGMQDPPPRFGVDLTMIGQGVLTLATVISGFSLTVVAIFLERRGSNNAKRGVSDRHLYLASNSIMIMACAFGIIASLGGMHLSTLEASSISTLLASSFLFRILFCSIALFVFAVFLALQAGSVREESGSAFIGLMIVIATCGVLDLYWQCQLLTILFANRESGLALALISLTCVGYGTATLSYWVRCKEYTMVYGERIKKDHAHHRSLSKFLKSVLEEEHQVAADDVRSIPYGSVAGSPFLQGGSPRMFGTFDGLSTIAKCANEMMVRKHRVRPRTIVRLLIGILLTYFFVRGVSLPSHGGIFSLHTEFVFYVVGAVFLSSAIGGFVMTAVQSRLDTEIGVRSEESKRTYYKRWLLFKGGGRESGREDSIFTYASAFQARISNMLTWCPFLVTAHLVGGWWVVSWKSSLLMIFVLELVSVVASLVLLRLLLGKGLPVVAPDILSHDLAMGLSKRKSDHTLLAVAWNTRIADEGDEFMLLLPKTSSNSVKTFKELFVNGVNTEPLTLERLNGDPLSPKVITSSNYLLEEQGYLASIHALVADPERWYVIGCFPYQLETKISQGFTPKVVSSEGIKHLRSGFYYEYAYAVFKLEGNVKSPKFFKVAYYDEDSGTAISNTPMAIDELVPRCGWIR